MNRSERRRLAKQQRGGAQAADVGQLLSQAVGALEAGRPSEAAKLCRQVLKRSPDHPDALNLAGVAAFHLGDAERALKLLRSATARRPEQVESHNNLGNVLRMMGRTGEAEAAYREALAIAPQHGDSLFNLGLVLEALERPAEAVDCYRQVLDQRPDFADAQLSLGNALKALDRLEEAEAAYRRAIALAPGQAAALINLGVVLRERGRAAEAEETYRQAIALAPRNPAALYNLGIALQDQERLDEAEVCYREVLGIAPDYVQALINLGYALQSTGRRSAAVMAYERAVDLAPHLAEAWVNLAEARLELGEPERALADCEAFLEEHPGNTALLACKAVLLNELGRDEALEALVVGPGLIAQRRFTEAPDGRDIAALNAALVEHLLAHPTLVEAPASHATKDGRHSGELLVEPKGPMAELERMITEAVEGYGRDHPAGATHPFLDMRPPRFALTVWGVVLSGAGHQVAHIHPSAWLSGVYYPKVPAAVDEPGSGQAGWIEFGRPPAHLACQKPPKVTLYRPEEGLMLLFPSYLYHRTIPFEGEQTRVSIAFDVRPMA